MVRAIMHGCNGAMGRVIAGLAENDEDISIVAGIDIADNKDTSFPVFTSLDECTVKADVMIDFSIAKAADTMLSWCERTGMPVVVCTTGLSEAVSYTHLPVFRGNTSGNRGPGQSLFPGCERGT